MTLNGASGRQDSHRYPDQKSEDGPNNDSSSSEMLLLAVAGGALLAEERMQLISRKLMYPMQLVVRRIELGLRRELHIREMMDREVLPIMPWICYLKIGIHSWLVIGTCYCCNANILLRLGLV